MRAYTFHKGLRLDKPEWELGAGEVPELTNFTYGENQRLLRKRGGLSRVVQTAAGASPIQGLHRSSVGGTNPHTLVATGGSIYRVLDNTPSWDAVESGLSSTNPVRFDTWKEKVFFVNGADELHAWDGISVGKVANAPAGCRFVRQFADRLFAASSSLYPDTLFYSDLLDPDTWVDPETAIAFSLDVSTGDNQAITGVARTRDQLTIFKSNSIFYLRGYDPEEWVLQRVTDGVGCIAPGSVVEIDGRTFFLSARGVYMDDGSSFFRVGSAVQPLIESFTMAQQAKAVGVKSGWNYLLFFPDTPVGPIGVVYHVQLQAWALWTLSVPIGAVCALNLPTDDPGWIGGHSESGYIYRGETGGTDDGSDIKAILRLPTIGMDTPEAQFDLRRLALDGIADEGDVVKIIWTVDGGTANERTFTGSDAKLFSIPVSVGQKIGISVEIDGSGTTSLIRGLAGEVRLRRRRW